MAARVDPVDEKTDALRIVAAGDFGKQARPGDVGVGMGQLVEQKGKQARVAQSADGEAQDRCAAALVKLRGFEGVFLDVGERGFDKAAVLGFERFPA